MKNFMLLTLLLLSQLLFAATDLSTIAERSTWTKTGRADEVSTLCQAFAKSYPRDIKCLKYGETPEGRTLQYLRIGTGPSVVWVQAGIHAGEIDGKDATFLLLKEIFQKKIKFNPFKDLTLIFIPIVNLDGHERIGRWNRPNQIGPEEQGWRTTAQNYNMNRDFAKADSPEMIALLNLWKKENPILSLDLHVTDGANFQPEVGIITTPTHQPATTQLHLEGKLLETAMMEKLKSRNHLALPYYPSFITDDRPFSGFGKYVPAPRFAHGYWYNNHRLGMLVETHSWKDYATRVKTHHDVVLSALELAAAKAPEWIKAARKSENESISGSPVDLEFKTTANSSLIDFPGYKFVIAPSAISGQEEIKYDSTQPEVWKVPFFEELVPSLTVKAPVSGYFIPASVSDIFIPRLNLHGIQYQKLTESDFKSAEVFRATTTEFSKTSFEGHQTLKVTGQWQEEKITIAPGTLYVPINQPKARMLMQLLEPQAQDSLLAWGYLNRYFEQKEYMENYVANDVAIEMLKETDLKMEFEEKLKSDPAFAKDPSKRLQFFYEKHSSWDKLYNLYPVFRK